MLQLLFQGQYLVFFVILVAIIFSLSLHEFGHASFAWALGDDTAQRQGRLTLNPFSHIDPVGLLMVVLVGFGYARPVPINPNRLHGRWRAALVAAAGPLMNLLLAIVAINLLAWAATYNAFELTQQRVMALTILAQINLLLMLFNLMPLGPLDGHYIFSWFLPSDLRSRYDYFNARYGTQVFLVLIILSIVGIPIFRFLMHVSSWMVPFITFIR